MPAVGMSVAALLRGGAWGQAGTPADDTDASFSHWESAGELGRSLAEEAKIERDAKLYGSWVGTRYITDAERNLIIVAASISVLSLLALLYLYYIKRSPFMRRHPGHLTAMKSICELVFCVMCIVVPLQSHEELEGKNDPLLAYHEDNDESGDYAKVLKATNLTRFLASATEWGILGSELWFFCMSIDLQYSITNPFSSYGAYRNFYLMLGFGVPTFMALNVYALESKDVGVTWFYAAWVDHQPCETYNATLETITITEAPHECRDTYSVDPFKWVFLFGWVVVIYLYSLSIWIYASRRLSAGIQSTLAQRKETLKRSGWHLISMYVYWFVPTMFALVEWMIEIHYNDKGNNRVEKYADLVNTRSAYHIMAVGLAVMLAFRGTWSFITILFINRHDLFTPSGEMIRSMEEEKKSFTPHLNATLRKEILYYSTLCIRLAVERNGENDEEEDEVEVDPNSSGSEKAQRPTNTRASSSKSLRHKSKVAKTMESGDLSKAASGSKGGDKKKRSKVRRVSIPDLGNSFTSAKEALGDDDEGNRPSGAGGGGDRRKSFSYSVNQVDNPIMQHIENDPIMQHLERDQREKVRAQSASVTEEVLSELGIEDADYDREEAEAFELNSSASNPSPLHNAVDVDKLPRANTDPTSSASSKSSSDVRGSAPQPGPGIGAGAGGGRLLPMQMPTGGFADGSFSAPARLSRPPEGGHGGPSEPSHMTKREVRTSSIGDRDSVESRAASDAEINNSISSSTRGSNNSMSSTFAVSNLLSRGIFKYLCPNSDVLKFVDYQPQIFQRIRESAGLNPVDYAESWTATTRESFSEGASGAFLFFSKDGEYIVKTTNREEMHVLDSIAHDYEQHLLNNPDSRLMRIYGAHSMEIYGQKLYFLVMNNIFPAPRFNIKIDERYDLKGSWVNRQSGGYNKPRGIVLKDMDLNFSFKTRPNVGHDLAEAIKRDANFLASKNIMDYSLLVGVVQADLDIHVEEERRSTFSGPSSGGPPSFVHPDMVQEAGGVAAPGGEGEFLDPYVGDEHGGMQASVVTGPTKFYVGIIDILQTWNARKRLERYSKIGFKLKDGAGLSAIEPWAYKRR
mmetsp:Transcript_32620/g.86026  ORF Transcript_32620/g.86026 Transcript_32620/m.86026 type:complete len:1083 (+) Transcript_32620:268-3516(+)